MPDHAANEIASEILAEFAEAIDGAAARPVVLGLAGAQGSGKTTIARRLVQQLRGKGRRAAAMSIDDFYYSRSERRRIASTLHPLFVTRGAPGTHDAALALSVLDAVRKGEAAPAPAFDKARDEPLPRDEWPTIPPSLDVLVFEGWCLGARPEAPAALRTPVNMLERDFDANGGWRRAVNDALGGVYQELFAAIDALVFLRAPSFEIVRRWRTEQERALASSPHLRPSPGLMTAEEISFFIQHFERVTVWMMEDLPQRADMTLYLNERRRIVRAKSRARRPVEERC
jgi:D-glycerate 3-kinase